MIVFDIKYFGQLYFLQIERFKSIKFYFHSKYIIRAYFMKGSTLNLPCYIPLPIISTHLIFSMKTNERGTEHDRFCASRRMIPFSESIVIHHLR